MDQCPLYSREFVEWQVEHRIPDVLGNEKARYDGKLTLVVGAGASAATVLQSLKALGAAKVALNVGFNDSLLEIGCMGHKKGGGTLCCTRRGSFASAGEALQTWQFVGSSRRGNFIPHRRILFRRESRQNKGFRLLDTWEVLEWSLFRKRSRLPSLFKVSIFKQGDKVLVSVDSMGKNEVLEVDNILAMVGYRPETAITEELQVRYFKATGTRNGS